MSDLADRATEFWSASARSVLETVKTAKRDQALSESATTKVSAAVMALTLKIKDHRQSTPAELDAHTDAMEAHQSAVVENLDSLRRVISSTQILEPSFLAELGASVDALRSKLSASCTSHFAALREIAREWHRFSGEAASATNDKVAVVRLELDQLDVRKTSVTAVASTNGERLIRQAEQNYKQTIESIDASGASTYASRPYQYWSTLIGMAIGGGIAAAVFGAAEVGRILTALILAGVAWYVMRMMDRSTEKTHAHSKSSLREQAEAARRECIRRVSREQEEYVRAELEHIGEHARKLQRELENATSNLSVGRERAQQKARDLASQERTKLEQTWGVFAGITTEVTKLFQVRLAKAIGIADQASREHLLNGIQKCQADIDSAVSQETKERGSKCKVGLRDIPAPGELRPYLEGDKSIRVPLIIDWMDSCYLKHDTSAESVDAARRLASWHAMEIWRRTGTARANIFAPAGLGVGYGELFSIDAEEDHLSLLASTRDVSELLSELVRTAAARNRTMAANRESDWLTSRMKTGTSTGPAEVLVLEVPRAGLGSDQRAQIEALLGVGPSAGVVLIVLEAKDRSDNLGIPLGMAREVELQGSIAYEKGYVLDVPDRDDLARMAQDISDAAADRKLQPISTVTSADPPAASFADFIDRAVPEDARWKSDRANTDENISIPIGVTDKGDVTSLVFDDGAPHALLLGGTGSGKTNFLHTLIQAGCIKFSPDELRIYLADLKSGVSFEPYARLDDLGRHFGAVACTSSVVFGAVLIDAAKQEMQKRYDAFKLVQRRQGESIKGLADYRRLANSSDGKIPRLLVIIDEFQALFDDAARRRQTLENLVTLLKQGRQVGVHVMLATQSLRGKAGDLDQALSQIHTRMILPAAVSDANSIFRSMSQAQQAVDHTNKPGKCYVSRDFGEKSGIGFTNPESKGNSFFFSTLESLTKYSPPTSHLVPIVWSDEVGSLRDNYQFRSAHESRPLWYLGVPYSAQHALAVPLENSVTTAAVAVEDRGLARALVASLLMSLLQSFGDIDVYWVQVNKDGGPLRQRDFDAMVRDLGLANVKHLDSLRALSIVIAMPGGDGRRRPQVVIVPDVTALNGKRSATGSSWAGPLTGGVEADAFSDIDSLRSIVSISDGPPKIVVMLSNSCQDLMDGPSKSASDLATIRVASGRLKGSRTRDFLKISDLPEMSDEDLVVTTEENRRPITFRPFKEQWTA